MNDREKLSLIAKMNQLFCLSNKGGEHLATTSQQSLNKFFKRQKAASAEVVQSPATENLEQNNSSSESADSESGYSDDEKIVVTKVLRNDIGFTSHVNESTDVADQKHLILYTTYVDQKTAEPTTRFLGLVEVLKANARSIARLIKNYLTEAGILLHKILHFTSDGASVMLGRQNGVAAFLRSKYGVDHLTDLHCAAYREAFAIKHILNDIVSCSLSILSDQFLGHILTAGSTYQDFKKNEIEWSDLIRPETKSDGITDLVSKKTK
uniref:DUF4371 domain-containing protein n=1 Tax=Romanomermis culicivorax TaxID=13658 RepID=A0A915J1F2_ROMCU